MDLLKLNLRAPERVRVRTAWTILLLCLFLFFFQGVFFIRANSQTVDEATHLAAGYSYLATGIFRLDIEHPPLVKLLQALPLRIAYGLSFPNPQYWDQRGDYLLGHDFLYDSAIPAERLLNLSRLVNLLLGGALIALIGWWTYRLWGFAAALLATALASLEPNLLAHSSLVTTDVGVALFMLLAVYLLWEYSKLPRWRLLTATGIATGLALVSKYSALLLLPIIGLTVGMLALLGGSRFLPLKRASERSPAQNYVHAAVLLCAIFFIASLVIPPAYFFQGYEPWLAGLRRFQNLADAGRLAFFMGEYSYQGWCSYYIVAFVLKTPIGILLLVAASLTLYRFGKPLDLHQAVFLLLPVIFIFVAMTQSKVNIGLRHVLPVYPFLLIVAARLATVSFRPRWIGHALIAAPLVFTAYSALRIAPHQLAYFNELAGGPEHGYRYLSDSNVDWGQDLKTLKAYMDKEQLPIIYLSYFGTAPPAYYGIRYQYLPGTWPLEWPLPSNRVPESGSPKILAISVYNLQDVSNAYAPLFQWLWRREPLAKLGYSIFVYDLTKDREGLARLAETYSKAGISRPENGLQPLARSKQPLRQTPFLISPNKRHR
jgi:4-amino-4-deoxy-L-arabinose transferase-like glycosyltransferase